MLDSDCLFDSLYFSRWRSQQGFPPIVYEEKANRGCYPFHTDRGEVGESLLSPDLFEFITCSILKLLLITSFF